MKRWWIAGSVGIALCLFLVLSMGSVALAENTYDLPTDGTWVRGEFGEESRDAYFYFTISAPSKVTVDMRSYVYGASLGVYNENLAYIGHDSTISGGSVSNPDIRSVNAFLNPGRYVAQVNKYVDDGYFEVRVNISTGGLTEVEPNDTREQAMPISLNKPMIQSMTADPYDEDFYRLTILETRGVKLDLSGLTGDLYYEVYDENMRQLAEGSSYNEMTSSYTMTRKLLLQKGTYYIRIIYNYQKSLYNIKVTSYKAATSLALSSKTASVVAGKTIKLKYTALPSNYKEKLTWETTGSCTTVDKKGTVKGITPGKDTITIRSESGLSASCVVTVKAPAATSIKLPKTAKIVKNFKYTLPVTIKPQYATPKLTWSTSNKKVATVDKGIITAKAKGKATITAKTKDGKLSSKCTVTVVDNSFSRSKPLYGKEKYVYMSTKRMYFKGDYFYLEIFVYNNTGRTITKIDDAYLLLLDLREEDEYDMVVYEKYIGRWKPSGGSISNKSYKVYSTKLPKKYFTNFDVGSGMYEAVLDALFYGKSNSSFTPRIMPLVEDGRPISLKNR